MAKLQLQKTPKMLKFSANKNSKHVQATIIDKSNNSSTETVFGVESFSGWMIGFSETGLELQTNYSGYALFNCTSLKITRNSDGVGGVFNDFQYWSFDEDDGTIYYRLLCYSSSYIQSESGCSYNDLLKASTNGETFNIEIEFSE